MPKGNRYDAEHLRNISSYQRQIDEIFKRAAEEAARIAESSGAEHDPDKVFSFDDYPSVRKRVDKMTADLSSRVERTIVNGIKAQWDLSNRKNDDLVETVTGLKADDFPSDQRKRYFGTNESARRAFLDRREKGLSLSDKVWKQSERFRKDMELGIDVSLGEGMSADELGRRLRGYLNHPETLFSRVRDERGNLVLSKNAAVFHPGRGVYRSSYMNARRLAATETNMAYRSADHERWKDLDFVVGIEIQTSNNHTTKTSAGKTVELEDICDTLAGRYPKGFKFVGWHPHCRCIATTILKTEEEMEADTERMLNGEEPLPPDTSRNYIGELPDKFTKWLDKNAERIENAKSLPYFLKDNQKLIEEGGKGIPQEIAEALDAMKGVIPNVRELYGKYSMEELQEANDYIEKLLAPLNSLSPETRFEKLKFFITDHLNLYKIDGFKKDVRAWEVVKDAVIDEIVKACEQLGETAATDDVTRWLLSLNGSRKVVSTQKQLEQSKTDSGDIVLWDRSEGIVANDVLFDTTSKNWIGADRAERLEMYGYTEKSSWTNEPLQGRDYGGEQTRAEFENRVNNITSYIDKNELPVDMCLQRGDKGGLSVIKARLGNMGITMPSDIKDLIGLEMREDGFLSTSCAAGKGYTENMDGVDLITYIHAPKGTKAAYVEPFSYHGYAERAGWLKYGYEWNGKDKYRVVGREAEATLQRGTTLRIDDVKKKNGVIYLFCEVTEQSPRKLSYVKDSNIGKQLR